MSDPLDRLEAAITLALVLQPAPHALPEALEPEERAELIADQRAIGRSIASLADRLLADEGEAGRLARWRARLARYHVMGGSDPARLDWFRDHEARALAWLADSVRPAGTGRTRLAIGAVEVLWTDDTAAWSIALPPTASQPHPETLSAVGIVALWMLARDVTGIAAEAEIAEAVHR